MQGSNSRSNVSEGYKVPLSYRGDRSCLFFLRIAGVAQAIMLWHMLLFGDAFGPAYYAIFWCFCIQLLCSFGGGSNFKKCFQQAITLLYGRFRRSQQCCVQHMCVQQYVCVYAKYTLCVHIIAVCVVCVFFPSILDIKFVGRTSRGHTVRPRNIPRNNALLMFMCIIMLYQYYHVSYASDLACIKHNRVIKAAGRAFMRFVAHLMLLCLLCCALCLFFAEHCLFSDMLFHMLFMSK